MGGGWHLRLDDAKDGGGGGGGGGGGRTASGGSSFRTLTVQGKKVVLLKSARSTPVGLIRAEFTIACTCWGAK